MTTNKIGSGTSQTASSIANVSGNYLSYNGDYSGSYTSWTNSISMGNNIRVKHVLGWN